jgi:diacylglycerol kinase family enzyme
MRWLAIANPAAGRPTQVRHAVAALGCLDGAVQEVVFTHSPGDATRLAREASRYDGLIAIGGDGTIGEVLNGMRLDRQALAILPVGHGNCLARDLGLGGLPVAIEALRRPRFAPLDLLDVQVTFHDQRRRRRYCASTIAAGYVAQVVATGRTSLAWLGSRAYAAAAMLTLPSSISLRLEPATGVQRHTGIVINNTRHLANFRGLPEATVHDGKLDVMELDAGWPRQMLHNLAVLAGSRRFGPAALAQCRGVRLTFDEPCTVMADGEFLTGVHGLEVECRPGVVHCVAASR